MMLGESSAKHQLMSSRILLGNEGHLSGSNVQAGALTQLLNGAAFGGVCKQSGADLEATNRDEQESHAEVFSSFVSGKADANEALRNCLLIWALGAELTLLCWTWPLGTNHPVHCPKLATPVIFSLLPETLNCQTLETETSFVVLNSRGFPFAQGSSLPWPAPLNLQPIKTLEANRFVQTYDIDMFENSADTGAHNSGPGAPTPFCTSSTLTLSLI